jgi:hypothetical protein
MCMNFVTEKHCTSGAVTPLPHTSSWCALRKLHFYLCLYLWTGYSVLHRAAIRSLSLISRHSYCQYHSNVNRRPRAVHKPCGSSNTQNECLVYMSIGATAGSFCGVVARETAKCWQLWQEELHNVWTLHDFIQSTNNTQYSLIYKDMI